MSENIIPRLMNLEERAKLHSRIISEYPGLVSIEMTKQEAEAYLKAKENDVNNTQGYKKLHVIRRMKLLGYGEQEIKHFLHRRQSNKEAQNQTIAGYVYLLQSPTNAYKIGRAKNPHNRLKTFEVKLPFEVQYIALIKTPDMRGLEQQMHDYFSEKRINGEWFELSSEDVEYIKGLQS